MTRFYFFFFSLSLRLLLFLSFSYLIRFMLAHLCAPSCTYIACGMCEEMTTTIIISLSLSSSIAWWASVHACLAPLQTCSATRGLYLHKRNVKSMCPCMFCSESNCLLKSRSVSSNLRCHYHQSVCVTTRELTYSPGTRQTAWFYGTCFKHSLRRLIDLSSCCLCTSFVLSDCLSVLSWLTYVQVEW